eukprot:363766-Chlamydomonas_euryale.AAC.5
MVAADALVRASTSRPDTGLSKRYVGYSRPSSGCVACGTEGLRQSVKEGGGLCDCPGGTPGTAGPAQGAWPAVQRGCGKA